MSKIRLREASSRVRVLKIGELKHSQQRGRLMRVSSLAPWLVMD